VLPAERPERRIRQDFPWLAKFSGPASSGTAFRGSSGSIGDVKPRCDFVEKLALALGESLEVLVPIPFFEPLQHLALLHRFDQGLALLLSPAFGAGHELLLGVDVALQALQISLEEEHVGAAKGLPLSAALLLQALSADAFLFSQKGLGCR